ncbi:hypothetical protein PF008_g31381 [Phytophthora fragariae]|uniref:Reverse transcriptase domain-containing protein n=1 Tax=Phytophthora fragariae TaxID=53985 RepID=A0A6G0Q2T5_9STRA|nr:hypothetical protein PF008_g31381 [Phytophthora fragariae]
MSMEIYEQFVMACPEAAKAVRLEKPLVCNGADGEPIEVKLIVNLHLKLTTAAGSVRIAKPVECLIIPGDSTEFLLGNDVLNMLGIDVSRQLDPLVANATRDEREDEFDDIHEPQIGSSAGLDADVLAAVEKMIESAVQKGFPKESVPRLRRIATRYDIWRLRLGDDPPARVPPMKIRLKPGAKPYRCKPRKYPPEVRRFLDDFNAELVRLGWVYENTESRWACPALPVRKTGGEFRQTADYKPVNGDMEAIVGVMPNLQTDLECAKEACFLACLIS